MRIGAHELLQAPLNPYAPRTHNMPFYQGDASGWDECLPSVAECSLTTAAGTTTVPDHGDLWRVPWQVIDHSQDAATMRVNCFSLPLQLTRSTILTASSTGYKLRVLYSLTNMGAYVLPWSWSAHPLFSVEAGDFITLPDSVHTLRVEGSRDNRLGSRGDTIAWPVTALLNHSAAPEEPADLSRVLPATSEIGDKLFAGPLQSGWGSLERPSIGMRLTVRFDPALTPYLGLWICYGGWPEAPGPKQVCVALEPATAPVDSLAETGSWSKSLEPGETFNWPMEVEVELLR